MLQQTQVQTVIPYYNRWVDKFPTLKHVATATDNELFKHWEGLGYYQRVKNFRDACTQVLDDYNGIIPKGKNELINLKGIGAYTSSAIASIAFNRPHYVLDGNVKRVMSRLLCLPNFLSKSMNKIDKFLSHHISVQYPGDFNQALMDLGRYVCTPKTPKCAICPISIHCNAYLKCKVDKYPIKIKSTKEFPHYNIGVGVIWYNENFLITKRKKDGLLGGLWEFPGGKIEDGETHQDCINREMKEELNIVVDISSFITTVNHKYSHFSITLHAYNCSYKSGDIKCNVADDFKWISPCDIIDYPFPKANHHIFPHIINNKLISC